MSCQLSCLALSFQLQQLEEDDCMINRNDVIKLSCAINGPVEIEKEVANLLVVDWGVAVEPVLVVDTVLVEPLVEPVVEVVYSEEREL